MKKLGFRTTFLILFTGALIMTSTGASKQLDRDVSWNYGSNYFSDSHHNLFFKEYGFGYGSDESVKPYLGVTCNPDEVENQCGSAKLEVANKYNLSLHSGENVEKNGRYSDSDNYFFTGIGPNGNHYATHPNVPIDEDGGAQANLKPGKYNLTGLYTRFTENSDNDYEKVNLGYFQGDPSYEFRVYPRKVSGENLVIKMDINPVFKQTQLMQFRLVSDQGDNITNSDGESYDPNAGELSFIERDGLSSNDKIYAEPKKGYIMDSGVQSASDYIDFNKEDKSKFDCQENKENACDVANEDFTSANDIVGTHECGVNCVLGHKDAAVQRYDAKRDVVFENLYEIIVGYKYGDNENVEQKASDKTVPPKFHICGKFRKKASKPVYSGGNRYVCNAETGEWEKVSVCNDGVDNDGDGKADLKGTSSVEGSGGLERDRACGVKDGKAEEYSKNCKPTVGTVNDTVVENQGLEDSKVAFYNPGEVRWKNEKNNCWYGDFDAEVADISQKEMEFVCNGNNELVSHSLVSTEDVAKSDISEDDIKKKVRNNANSVCLNIYEEAFFSLDSGLGEEYAHGHGSLDIAVTDFYQLILPEENIPYGKKYAAPYGYRPFKQPAGFEVNYPNTSLARAEYRYIGDSGYHDSSSYEELNLPESTADVYNSGDPRKFREAWTVANFNGLNNERVRGINIVRDSQGDPTGIKRFQGGYALKCPKGNPFGYYNDSSPETNYRWMCQEGQAYEYIDVVVPDVEKDTNYVGFKVMPATFVKYWNVIGRQIDGIQGKCWRGEPEDKPSSFSEDQKFSYSGIAKSDIKTTLSEIGDSFNVKVSGVDTGEDGNFTCSFKFEDTSGVIHKGEKFDVYNWFGKKEIAGDLVSDYNDLLESGKLSKEGLEAQYPDYYQYKNITNLESRVAKDFFERDMIAQ